MFAFGLLPCLIRLFVLLFIYKFETPHYSLRNNQIETAINTLSKIFKIEFC